MILYSCYTSWRTNISEEMLHVTIKLRNSNLHMPIAIQVYYPVVTTKSGNHRNTKLLRFEGISGCHLV